MAGRTDWLTEFAKPIADKLAARTGTLKRVLSAGVMALNDLTATDREKYMAKAMGKDIKPANDPPSEDEVYDEIEKLAIQWKLTNEKIQAFQAANHQIKTRLRRKKA